MTQNLHFQKWTIPLTILFVCFVSYGLLIPWLGFYWDDWHIIFLTQTQGIGGVQNYLQFDRPFSAWTYVLTTPILGTTPLNRHIFALLTRYLCVLGMWWCLHGLWPHRTKQVTWMALLFAVYPIFFKQTTSVIYGQVFILFGLFFISLGAMVWAVRKLHYYFPLTILALIMATLHLFSIEYFTGLELLRPLLLWFLLEDKDTNKLKRIKSVIKNWLPYLILLIISLYWRFFLVKLAEDTYVPTLLYRIVANPLPTLIVFFQTIFQDCLHIILTSWYNTLQPTSINLNMPFIVFSWLVVLFTVMVISIYMYRGYFENEETGDMKSDWRKQGLFLGGCAILVGMLPVWLIERSILNGFHSDRFGLAALFGASIFLVSFVYIVVSHPLKKVIILSTLVSLAIGLHIRIANEYRWDWKNQLRFYWQLYWRAPGLKTGTAIVTDDSIFTYVTRYSLSAALNTLYHQETKANTQALWYFELYDVIPGANQTPQFINGLKLEYTLRNLSFSGTSKNSLIISNNPRGSCWWVLNPNDVDNTELPQIIRDILPVANPGQIIPDSNIPGYPPKNIFGPEPAHNWCYYYEKADLARQLGDWEKVILLGEEAEHLELTPDDQFEMLPFIEAYAMLGRWDKAENLSREVYQEQSNIEAILCSTWERIEASTHANSQRDSIIARVNERVKCP